LGKGLGRRATEKIRGVEGRGNRTRGGAEARR